MIIVTGTFEIAAKDREDAMGLLREMSRASQAEEGCLVYAFYEDIAQPGVYRIYEEWQDQAAIEAHFASSHMAVFQESISQMEARNRNIKRYEATEIGTP